MDTPREPLDMEEESVTDTESESEPDCDTLSSTGSESLSENDIEKRGEKLGKRNMKKQSCKKPCPSSLCTPSKKRQAKESSQYLNQNKSELVVTCGDKEGVLYVEKYNVCTVQKCIFSEGQWFKPNEFERFGGKEKNKKWKISICCNGISLQKLIEDGCLPSIKKRRVQNEQCLSVAQENSPGSSPVSGRLRRRRKCRRPLFFSSSDSDGSDDDDDDDEDDAINMKKPQDMESKSVIDISSESESESKWDPERSTGSGSPSDNDREKRGKQEKKRKMRKRSCKQTGPHSLSTPNKKSQAKDTSQYMRQKYQNKLPVTCGDKKGVLYVEKYNDKQKCILSEGQWFKPNEFEQFGGKGRCKNSTKSILFNGIQLRKLIEDRVLLPIKKRLVQNEQIDSPESSPVTGRLRKRKSREQLLPSTSESHDMGNGDDGNDVDEDDDDRDDDVDMTVFDSPTLPVTCGSKSGILHKCRFAKGHCGRCIRTEDSWLSPDDFIRLNKPNGTWRKDIVTYGIPLGKLIMKRVLEPHMINCDCEICEEKDQYLQNDDVCFVCDSGGDLVCCDECPRAFHSHCHLPAADEDSPGSKWSCTFCVMKKTADSSQKTQQEVLSSPVSQYILHCQYLLLHLLHESMTDPCTNVSGYSENICGPMMLGRVKLNLETNHNQTVQEFVSDIEQIFNNCCTSSGDNDSSRMTSRLKEAFKKEFETVFKLL